MKRKHTTGARPKGPPRGGGRHLARVRLGGRGAAPDRFTGLSGTYMDGLGCVIGKSPM